MAELNPQERLQPFLLDRLTDNEPQKQVESREQRVLTSADQRRSLLRDLGALLNANNHPASDGLENYPEVARSVLNYGVPELAGVSSSFLTPEEVERIVTAAIVKFEPRILRRSLRVRAIEVAEEHGANVVVIEIRGDVWNLPMPDSLYVRTKVDLETGRCELRE